MIHKLDKDWTISIPTSDSNHNILPKTRPFCSSALHMAGSKSLNKQAALRLKLEQARQQNVQAQNPGGAEYPLTDAQIRERNDRLRFEELLQKKGGTLLDDSDDKEYKSRQQEEDEIDAVRKCFSSFCTIDDVFVRFILLECCFC
jgi:hypothetical protein